MSRIGVLFLITLIFFCVAVSAQVVQLSAPNELSSDRVRLDFEQYQRGTPGADLFGQWGVQFTTTGLGEVVLDSITLGLVGRELVFLTHDANSSTGLVIDFHDLVTEVGFLLRAEPDTTARLTAFDGVGNELGFVQQAGFQTEGEMFLGIASSPSSGMRKVILDYGDSMEPPKIVDLFFTLQERKPFLRYLAQVADGKLPSGSLATTIVISNLSNTDAVGEVDILGDDGSPLQFQFVGGAKTSRVPFVIGPNASQKLVTNGTTSPPAQGYIRVTSDVPMEATAIFQILDSQGVPISEAGVGGSSAVNQLVAVVSKEVGKQFDSGIAVVNLGTEPATGSIQLLRADGSLESSNLDFLNLGPGHHDADFLSQMFPAIFNRNFDGTLLIRSKQPLAVVVLRTVRGLVLSSLPVGTTQR